MHLYCTLLPAVCCKRIQACYKHHIHTQTAIAFGATNASRMLLACSSYTPFCYTPNTTNHCFNACLSVSLSHSGCPVNCNDVLIYDFGGCVGCVALMLLRRPLHIYATGIAAAATAAVYVAHIWRAIAVVQYSFTSAALVRRTTPTRFHSVIS